MRTQINIRLPDHTKKQIDELRAATGMTITQLIITAIGDYYRTYMEQRDKYNV